MPFRRMTPARPPRLPPAGTLLVLLATTPLAVAGQRADSVATADSARARAFLLPPVVVSAARTDVRPERVGFALGAILPDELALRRPRVAADALRDAAGAFIDEAAGPGGPAIVRLRGGEEVFTQILVDGVQVNENGGFFDFQGFAPSNIERIEIARGPQSALYGSSAVSGVVSFLTPRGRAGAPEWTVYAEGSDASANGRGWRATGDVRGGGERVTYSAGAGAGWQRGIYAVPHDTRNHDAALRLDVDAGAGLDITATGRWLAMEGNLPVRDAGATRVPLDPNARNTRDRLVSALMARWTAPSGRWSQHVRVASLRENFVYDDRHDGVADEVGEQPFFIFDANFTLDSDRARTTLEYGGSVLASSAATLSWGAQWERESLAETTAGDFGDGSQALDRTSRAAFAELLFSPAARVDLLAGVRVEKYEGVDAAWTPRASLVFTPFPGRLALRAAAGRAFKAPNLQQQFLDNPFIRANPDLAPETSTSWEVGIDAGDIAGRVALSLTWFSQRFDDLIRTVAIEGSPSGQQINRNLGESRARGLEWTALWRATPVWAVGARGAAVTTEIVTNAGLSAAEYPAGGSLPFRPVVVHTAYLETHALPRLSARLHASHVGEQIVLSERFSGRRVTLDGYVVTGLALRWAVREGVALHGRVDNLLDAEYETAFDRPGRPLDVSVGVRIGAR